MGQDRAQHRHQGAEGETGSGKRARSQVWSRRGSVAVWGHPHRGAVGLCGALTRPPCPSQIYRGHSSLVRCLSVSPSGQWLVSGEPSHPKPRHRGHAGRPGAGAGPSVTPSARAGPSVTPSARAGPSVTPARDWSQCHPQPGTGPSITSAGLGAAALLPCAHGRAGAPVSSLAAPQPLQGRGGSRGAPRVCCGCPAVSPQPVECRVASRSLPGFFQQLRGPHPGARQWRK